MGVTAPSTAPRTPLRSVVSEERKVPGGDCSNTDVGAGAPVTRDKLRIAGGDAARQRLLSAA